MGKRAENMIRARIRRGGRAVELGYFKTKAEVAAAQQVAHAILDEWDQFKKEPPKLPSPQILIEMIDQGAYDKTIQLLAQTMIRRQNLIKRMEGRQRHWAGTPTMEAKKWQALQEKERQDLS